MFTRRVGVKQQQRLFHWHACKKVVGVNEKENEFSAKRLTYRGIGGKSHKWLRRTWIIDNSPSRIDLFFGFIGDNEQMITEQKLIGPKLSAIAINNFKSKLIIDKSCVANLENKSICCQRNGFKLDFWDIESQRRSNLLTDCFGCRFFFHPMMKNWCNFLLFLNRAFHFSFILMKFSFNLFHS